MSYTIQELEEISGLMQGMVSALKMPNFDPAHWTTVHILNQTPTQEIRDWVTVQIERSKEDSLRCSHDAIHAAATALDSFKGIIEKGYGLDRDLIALLYAVAEYRDDEPDTRADATDHIQQAPKPIDFREIKGGPVYACSAVGDA